MTYLHRPNCPCSWSSFSASGPASTTLFYIQPSSHPYSWIIWIICDYERCQLRPRYSYLIGPAHPAESMMYPLVSSKAPLYVILKSYGYSKGFRLRHNNLFILQIYLIWYSFAERNPSMLINGTERPRVLHLTYNGTFIKQYSCNSRFQEQCNHDMIGSTVVNRYQRILCSSRRLDPSTHLQQGGDTSRYKRDPEGVLSLPSDHPQASLGSHTPTSSNFLNHHLLIWTCASPCPLLLSLAWSSHFH
jgi:hypothetical protein